MRNDVVVGPRSDARRSRKALVAAAGWGGGVEGGSAYLPFWALSFGSGPAVAAAFKSPAPAGGVRALLCRGDARSVTSSGRGTGPSQPSLAMGLIFAKLWSFFCDQEHKVIIVGLDNAGKTTILYQFLMNEVVHTSPTIGSNVEEIVVKNTHFLMWDIGGQESLRSSWNTYYSNTEFIILVVDSIDRERLSITKEELYKMLAHEIVGV
uniref:Uncharacterized protein n=1 Tax=Gopherus agassizii TaxID=38772 RepID=A0A452HJQ5_9SAUR